MDPKVFLQNIINFFVGLAVVILGLRVLFRLFDANPDAGFVEWIYRTGADLMAPFRGIFEPAIIERGIVLDIPALFSILMYVLLGVLLTALIGIIPGGTSDRPIKKSKR